MNRRFGWSDLLLSAAGRLARTSFWIASAGLIGLAALYEAAFGPTLHWLTGSKRLHDRGRSGWWAALVLFALVAVWPTPHGFGALLFSLILVWAAIELGVMQGEDGANRFGPSPLAQAA